MARPLIPCALAALLATVVAAAHAAPLETSPPTRGRSYYAPRAGESSSWRPYYGQPYSRGYYDRGGDRYHRDRYRNDYGYGQGGWSYGSPGSTYDKRRRDWRGDDTWYGGGWDGAPRNDQPGGGSLYYIPRSGSGTYDRHR
jgi:hypothetical protein